MPGSNITPNHQLRHPIVRLAVSMRKLLELEKKPEGSGGEQVEQELERNTLIVLALIIECYNITAVRREDCKSIEAATGILFQALKKAQGDSSGDVVNEMEQIVVALQKHNLSREQIKATIGSLQDSYIAAIDGGGLSPLCWVCTAPSHVSAKLRTQLSEISGVEDLEKWRNAVNTELAFAADSGREWLRNSLLLVRAGADCLHDCQLNTCCRHNIEARKERGADNQFVAVNNDEAIHGLLKTFLSCTGRKLLFRMAVFFFILHSYKVLDSECPGNGYDVLHREAVQYMGRYANKLLCELISSLNKRNVLPKSLEYLSWLLGDSAVASAAVNMLENTEIVTNNVTNGIRHILNVCSLFYAPWSYDSKYRDRLKEQERERLEYSGTQTLVIRLLIYLLKTANVRRDALVMLAANCGIDKELDRAELRACVHDVFKINGLKEEESKYYHGISMDTVASQAQDGPWRRIPKDQRKAAGAVLESYRDRVWAEDCELGERLQILRATLRTHEGFDYDPTEYTPPPVLGAQDRILETRSADKAKKEAPPPKPRQRSQDIKTPANVADNSNSMRAQVSVEPIKQQQQRQVLSGVVSPKQKTGANVFADSRAETGDTGSAKKHTTPLVPGNKIITSRPLAAPSSDSPVVLSRTVIPETVVKRMAEDDEGVGEGDNIECRYDVEQPPAASDYVALQPIAPESLLFEYQNSKLTSREKLKEIKTSLSDEVNVFLSLLLEIFYNVFRLINLFRYARGTLPREEQHGGSSRCPDRQCLEASEFTTMVEQSRAETVNNAKTIEVC